MEFLYSLIEKRVLTDKTGFSYDWFYRYEVVHKSGYLFGKCFRKTPKKEEIVAPSYQKPLKIILKSLRPKNEVRCVYAYLWSRCAITAHLKWISGVWWGVHTFAHLLLNLILSMIVLVKYTVVQNVYEFLCSFYHLGANNEDFRSSWFQSCSYFNNTWNSNGFYQVCFLLFREFEQIFKKGIHLYP